jgi:UDP-N-acetylmuramoylalanine--D-glutamate ligase
VKNGPDEFFDLCVTSPGVARSHPWLAACRQRKIPVIGELELGFAYWPGKILAVTGSKGKSSLVKLCADTLNRAGVTAAPAGNYGTPLSRLVIESPQIKWAVVEVSSFQLEHVSAFRPDVAVLLNVQPDHLDRHASMAEYRGLKMRMFAEQHDSDVALLPEKLRVNRAFSTASKKWRFGAGARCAWRYADHVINGQFDGGAREASITGSWFDNPVLGLAAAAGAGALTACGLTKETIADGLKNFVPLPHRMQRIAEQHGVIFVDDSKATSLAATAAALQMISGPVRLIAGGRLKEHNLNMIKDLLTRYVRKVYLIGECAWQMEAAWSNVVTCEKCGTLDRAVTVAKTEACAGETILLSPGCASFDQFDSYRDRGECFMRLVCADATS